jgi:hypothetical protein
MQLFRALTAHNEECGACRVSRALNGDRKTKKRRPGREEDHEEKKIRKRRRYIRSEEGRIS